MKTKQIENMDIKKQPYYNYRNYEWENNKDYYHFKITLRYEDIDKLVELFGEDVVVKKLNKGYESVISGSYTESYFSSWLKSILHRKRNEWGDNICWSM